MTAPPDATTADTSAIIALRTERDAALAREAALVEALAQRNSEFGERIDHQAASLDVLRSMSASPGDAQPVFDLIVRRAQELCNGTAAAVLEYDGQLVYFRSEYGSLQHLAPDVLQAYKNQYPMAPTPTLNSHRAMLEKRIIHVRDMDAEPEANEAARVMGWGSEVQVPLLRGSECVGVMALVSTQKGGISDAQIELLKIFAEQAVIAITSAETYRALQTRTSDLQETLEYQTATSDVLKVISRSTFDLQPVLDSVVATAARLCSAEMAAIARREGDLFRMVAHLGFPAGFVADRQSRGAMKLDRNGVTGRAVLEGRVIHVQDAASEPDYPDDAIGIGKQRSSLGVPLLRDDEVIGVIVLARKRVEPFTDRQIELVSTFADQAVIAIENTRLIIEQREALEQQTATADVLRVINASPGDLSPVFDAMLEWAMRLCGIAFGMMTTFDGERFHPVCWRGLPTALSKYFAEGGGPSGSSGMHAQLVGGAPLVYVADMKDEEAYRSGYPARRALVDRGGARTGLAIALRKEGVLLGSFMLYCQEVRSFSDKEIALLRSFGAQAVIAMENARLITETREALEQQTATAEVLQVINSSPGDLTPVFDAMLEKALHLCGSAFGVLAMFDGEAFHHVAFQGVTPDLAELLRKPARPGPGLALHRVVQGEDVVHIADIVDDDAYRKGVPGRRALADLGGARSQLLVALRKDDVLLGVLLMFRQEVRPFTVKQIALLRTFAAQAVIAIENARLLTEQREALEQQTATAEVLQVINASPGNLGPVFEVMLDKAMQLCQADIGAIGTFDGDRIKPAAFRGVPAAYTDYVRHNTLSDAPETIVGRILRGERIVHIQDVMAEPAYRIGHPDRRALVELGGARTSLSVALRKDDLLMGVLSFYRQNVRPFSERHIALLENFAAQAVIAMENARLLDELRQRQEELRVTFENMGDGVAMFDETQHLVAWNRKFQDILDVPDDVMARRQTFSEYVRYLAKRGEYGADADVAERVRRLLESAGQMRVFERVRPNGRVIEVRSNPVAGGGFVLIYADITERKRNEADIRAARDAAEEASRTIEAAYRELKATQANLIQAEKMASLGQLTAGIAHEIKNPLNFVNNFAALSVDLLSELKETAAPGFAALTEKQRAEVEDVSATLTSNLQKITEHGKRADNIVKAMLEHSRGSSGERRVVDLNALIDEALNLAYHGARAQDQSFDIALERNFGAASLRSRSTRRTSRGCS
ncbi:MAG TPA: GAF domain-containing protein [Acetobacteraceae bacterium]